MPVICATLRRARDFRRCDDCGKSIAPTQQYVRAYGYAERGDPPYAISLHIDCATTETRERLRPAPRGGA